MNRTVATALTAALVWTACWSAGADELADLKRELDSMRKDYEVKIARLESKIDTLGNQQNGIEPSPPLTEQKKPAVEYVGRYEGPFQKGGLLINNPFGFGSVSVGGYMDIEFENFQNTDSSFDQHRWIINIGAEVHDRLRFYSEYEIEHGGPDASGDGEAKVEQAWLDYLITDAINIRAGALLIPFGRYNLYHDSDLQDLTDRPLVARRIIPTTWTESGAGLHGMFNPVLGSYEDLELGYELYFVNGLNDGFSDSGLRDAVGSLGSDNNNSKAVTGRLSISPALGHELGLSGYWGDYDDMSNDISGGAVDWFSTWGPVEIVGEYASFDADKPAGEDIADDFSGYYVQANYHFWPAFLNDTFLGKDFENPTFTLVGRYGRSEIDDDSDEDVGDNQEERFTLGFNYRPVESWVFKTEYQWNKTDNETLEHGDNNGFAASMTIGF